MDPDRHGRADPTARREGPVTAAGLRIERVDSPVLTADKQSVPHDGRLRPGRRSIGEANGPFEPQLRHLRGGETRCRCRLQARVQERSAPSVPSRSCSWIEGRRLPPSATLGHADDIAAYLATAEKLGYRTALGTAQTRSLYAHRAVDERLDDRFRTA